MNESTHDPATDQDPTPSSETKASDCASCAFKKAMADAENSKTPKGHRRLIDEIKDLNIPSRLRGEVFALCVRARELGRKVIAFIKRHRHLGESIVLGCLIAYLLFYVPFIGGFLGLCALALTISSGVLRELQESIAALFSADIPVYA
jgi:hypothetical protein